MLRRLVKGRLAKQRAKARLAARNATLATELSDEQLRDLAQLVAEKWYG